MELKGAPISDQTVRLIPPLATSFKVQPKVTPGVEFESPRKSLAKRRQGVKKGTPRKSAREVPSLAKLRGRGLPVWVVKDPTQPARAGVGKQIL